MLNHVIILGKVEANFAEAGRERKVSGEDVFLASGAITLNDITRLAQAGCLLG